MTKNKTSLVRDEQNQLSLFDILTQARDERIAQLPGSLCISAKFLSAVKQAIKQAPKSRETIADEMTLLSGRMITVCMINNWTADSHPHDMPSELLHIFCTVCGCDAPLRLINDSYGLFTLPGPDALRAEIQKLDEEEKRVAAEKRKHKLLLHTLETKP
jgi:hypothetical protein